MFPSIAPINSVTSCIIQFKTQQKELRSTDLECIRASSLWDATSTVTGPITPKLCLSSRRGEKQPGGGWSISKPLFTSASLSTLFFQSCAKKGSIRDPRAHGELGLILPPWDQTCLSPLKGTAPGTQTSLTCNLLHRLMEQQMRSFGQVVVTPIAVLMAP